MTTNRELEEDLKLTDTGKAFIEQQPSDDCISRQAVIDNIDSISKHHGGISDIRLVVTELSPVTPTRKQSEWYLRGGKFTCKNCEERALLKLTDAIGGSKEYSYYTSNFCPNCGADMRGNEND